MWTSSRCESWIKFRVNVSIDCGFTFKCAVIIICGFAIIILNNINFGLPLVVFFLYILVCLLLFRLLQFRLLLFRLLNIFTSICFYLHVFIEIPAFLYGTWSFGGIPSERKCTSMESGPRHCGANNSFWDCAMMFTSFPLGQTYNYLGAQMFYMLMKLSTSVLACFTRYMYWQFMPLNMESSSH